MKGILLPFALFGAVFFASGREFQFHDTDDRCWRCSSGSECVRCDSQTTGRINQACIGPNMPDCIRNWNVDYMFPSRDLPFYFVCGPNFRAELRQCPCERVFDYFRQCCVFDPHLYTPRNWCVYNQNNIRGPFPCPEYDTTTANPHLYLCAPPSLHDCCSRPAGYRFPSRDLKFYYECLSDRRNTTEVFRERQCPCETLFDPLRQACVSPDILSHVACRYPTNVHPEPCYLTTEGIEIPTLRPKIPIEVPTLRPKQPIEVPTTIYPTTTVDYENLIPTLPTNTPPHVPTTTTTSYYILPTTTTTSPPPHQTSSRPVTSTQVVVTSTQGSGVDGGGGDSGNGGSKCVCVPWWPCPCNPCWHLPCHSCSGCFGIFG